MKSAGLPVRDLVWGNIAPLVLYTVWLQRCFLRPALPHLKAVLCVLRLPSECQVQITFETNGSARVHDIPRCLQALCLLLAFFFFYVLLFKNQSPANDRPQETVERLFLLLLPLPLSLLYPSLSPSARKVSLFTRAPTTNPTPPSLAAESGLRMPDVLQSEPRQCKHSALP